jgi:hypothetical protein
MYTSRLEPKSSRQVRYRAGAHPSEESGGVSLNLARKLTAAQNCLAMTPSPPDQHSMRSRAGLAPAGGGQLCAPSRDNASPDREVVFLLA